MNLKTRKYKFFAFILITIIYYSCVNSYNDTLSSSMPNGSKKQWNRIGYDSLYKDGQPSDFIIFEKNNTYTMYNFFKNGKIERTNHGDVIISNYYNVLSDSLMYLGNNYIIIKKITDDTLVLSNVCDGHVSIYKSVKLDSRIKQRFKN